jgi:hypothetical protein
MRYPPGESSNELLAFSPRVFARAWVVYKEVLDVSWVTESAGLEVLTLRMAEGTLRSLVDLPDAFTLGAFARAMGDHPDALDLAEVLLDHRIMIRIPDGTVLVRIWHHETECQTWRLPSSIDFEIRLLAGTERTLVKEFSAFAARQPETAFVGPLVLRHRDVQLGPVRWPAEVEPLVTRTVRTEWIPAASERRLLKMSLPRVRNLLEECIAGGSWYALTTYGLVEEYRYGPELITYEVNHSPPAPAHIRLCYFEASVEDGGVGSGTGRDAPTARAVAIGEAWERYALNRRDLAIAPPDSLPRISTFAGIHFTYLGHLAPDLSDPFDSCAVTAVNGARAAAAAPTAWIYTYGSPSAANSNGAAYGETLADAIESGFREVIERDLLMRVWLGLAGSRELDDAELLDTKASHWRFLAAEQGLNASWYRLDSGTNPNYVVVVCAAYGGAAPFVSVGAACRSSLGAAVEKAFFEAAGVRTLWSGEIQRWGRKGFCDRGRLFASEDDIEYDLVKMGWRWAADPAAPEAMHERFTAPLPPADPIEPEKAWYADATPPTLRAGFVAKVVHGDALPLPSCYAHLKILARLLGITEPLAIPLT